MGFFRKKIDAKTLEYLEKTDSAELIISSTIAVVIGPVALSIPMPARSGVVGTLVLNSDGTGFLWKINHWRYGAIPDEVKFGAIDSWVITAYFPNFDVRRQFDNYDYEKESLKERLHFIAGPWSFGLSEDPIILGDFGLVSEWMRHHYPSKELSL